MIITNTRLKLYSNDNDKTTVSLLWKFWIWKIYFHNTYENRQLHVCILFWLIFYSTLTFCSYHIFLCNYLFSFYILFKYVNNGLLTLSNFNFYLEQVIIQLIVVGVNCVLFKMLIRHLLFKQHIGDLNSPNYILIVSSNEDALFLQLFT